MKKYKSTLIVIFSVFLTLGCKKEIKKQSNTMLKNNKTYSKFRFIFPDTVLINKEYDGYINYEGKFDTITKSFDDLKKIRYIYYAYLKTDRIEKDPGRLQTAITDTFGAETHSKIPIYSLSFNKLGDNYIDGLIVDEVRIDTLIPVKGKKELYTRILTSTFRGTYKVFVKPNK